MTAGAAIGIAGTTSSSSASHRYAGVFVLTLALLVFEVLRPDADWALAVSVALQGGAIMVIVATSRVPEGRRRAHASVLAVGAAVLVAGAATGVAPDAVMALASGLLSAAIPVLLARGLVRLVREHGVTMQAVAGGLAIYLSVGLVFAWTIGAVGALGDAPYFAQGTDGSPGDRVYFSFTTLTTTGYGDLSPATSTGHAISVLEMLVGQLYLVTVVGVLVGRVVASASRA